MTPKEKANKIISTFFIMSRHDKLIEDFNLHTAKKCALIAVDEMIDIRNGLYINEGSIAHQWLLDVRQEIEKL